MSVRVPGRHNENLPELQAAVEQISQGRMNCTGTFTLAVSPATTTVVPAPTVAPGTIILLSPQTADAASAVPTTYVKASDVSQGSFTVTHASAASVDRTFGFVAIG